MNLVQRIEEAVALGAHAIDGLIAATEFPHVEGRSVTFLFRGEAQEAALVARAAVVEQHRRDVHAHSVPRSPPSERVLFVCHLDTRAHLARARLAAGRAAIEATREKL